MTKHKLVLLLLSAALLAAPAFAAPTAVLFNNFPINGNIDGWTINSAYSVSDSFTVSAGETITGVNFGVLVFPDDSITSVDWAIGGTPFGQTNAGTATPLTTVSQEVATGANTDGLDVYEVSFSLPTGLQLAAGTYYLTLENAVSADANPVYWDENDGAGVNAWESSLGQLSNSTNCQAPGTGSCAESFQILGTTPEPATFGLLGAALLAAFALRRKAVRRG